MGVLVLNVAYACAYFMRKFSAFSWQAAISEVSLSEYLGTFFSPMNAEYERGFSPANHGGAPTEARSLLAWSNPRPDAGAARMRTKWSELCEASSALDYAAEWLPPED